MARGVRSDGIMGVPQILNEAQRASARAHPQLAKLLWEVCLESPLEAGEQLQKIFKIFMNVPEVGACVVMSRRGGEERREESLLHVQESGPHMGMME